jgi:hypothetical protein
LIGVGNAYVGNALVALQVNNGIEKRDEDYFLFFVAKNFAKSYIVGNIYKLHGGYFEAKLQKKMVILKCFTKNLQKVCTQLQEKLKVWNKDRLQDGNFV